MANTDQIFPRLRRTLTGIFQLGARASGVQIKNNAGALQVRNPSDSAFASVEVDELRLVDPATPTRSIQLGAPTLPSGTGYALNLPTSKGTNNQHFKSDGAGGSFFEANTTGVYGYTSDAMYKGMIPHANSSGDPEFIPITGKHNYRMELGGIAPNPGSTSSTVAWYNCGGQELETLYDANTIGSWRDVWPNPSSLDFSSVGNQQPFLPQDVFWYYDGSGHALVQRIVPWQTTKSSKTITGVTNVINPVITVGSGHGFAVGDPVIIQDIVGTASVLNNTLYRVGAIATTTITIGTVEGGNVAAPGAYTSGGKAWPVDLAASPAMNCNYNNGILSYDISSIIGGPAPNYAKYMGTVCYGESKNLIYDTLNRPFIYNFYNQYNRPISTVPYEDTTLGVTVTASGDTPTNARACMNSHGWCRQWYLIGRWHGQPINIKFKCWRSMQQGVSTTGTHTVYLVRNAVANYDNATYYNYSPEIDTLAWINPATNLTNALIPMTIEAPPNVSNTGFYTELPSFGYWQAMEQAQISGANAWTIYVNHFGGNQYRYKGGFKGSYAR